MSITRRAAAAGLTAALAGPAQASAAPRRIVSLNPCLDVILFHVADRSQIAAISHYSRDLQGSSIGPAALGLPFTYESAEEVLALRPDLVLTSRHSAPATRAALKRLGVRTELFTVPDSIEESFAQIRQVAAAAGRHSRGEVLIRRIGAAVARAAPPPGAPPVKALLYQSRGFAAGPGTLMDEMMRRAGLVNAVTRYGLKRSGNVPLEMVIADPPDVLLAGEARPGAPTWADRVLSHPALARAGTRMRRVTFPERLTYCGGPVILEAMPMLARARSLAIGAGA